MFKLPRTSPSVGEQHKRKLVAAGGAENSGCRKLPLASKSISHPPKKVANLAKRMGISKTVVQPCATHGQQNRTELRGTIPSIWLLRPLTGSRTLADITSIPGAG